MSQNMGNGLNNVSDIAMDYVTRSKNVQTSSDFVQTKYENKDIDSEFETSYVYDKKDTQSTAQTSVMDNFSEYIREKNEQAKEEGADEQAKEREERENEKELMRSVSSEELRQLRMMGVDVEGAELSDISGIVNTMRGNAHRERTMQMLDEVMNGDSGAETLEMPSLLIGTSDVAADMTEASAVDIKRSDEAFLYIVKNDISMTADNMYKAFYSGSGADINSSAAIDGAALEQMMPQIDKVIEQAGYEGDERAARGAKLLLNSGLPVTTDTVKAYMDYTDESFVPVTDEAELTERAAASLYEKVNSVTPDVVYEMALEGKEVTVASAYSYYKSKNNTDASCDSGDYGQDLELAAVTEKRRIEEIRLSMTTDAARRLATKDINIETRELSKVVEELKNIEQELIDRQLKNAGINPTEESRTLYTETSDGINKLAEAPCGVIAAPLKGMAFTVNSLLDDADDIYETMSGETISDRRFETVRRSYEAVGTAPRADMGDSITKAFSNVDDILGELDMPVNDETRRAVRILGYNSIEITADNIDKVMDYDRQVNELITNYYPEAVLSSIRDGINPLDMEIGELNGIIREKNYNGGVTEADNFAAYLRDIENQNGITAEERESYIGIYRAVNKLASSGDREAGYLFANGGNLTVRNLISAMRSRRAAGMDISVDDSFGMLYSAETLGSRIDEQIASAFEADTNESDDTDTEDAELEISIDIDSITEAAERFMEENNISYSLVNANASMRIISDTGLYGLVSEILAGMRFNDETKENMIDEETDNMSRSMLGEDVPVEFIPDNILESLRNGTDMSLTYEDMRESLTELMYTAGAAGTLSSMDISAVKAAQAGFNILAGMARRDRYQVPVETENGISIVNLTVKHDDEAGGTVELSTCGSLMGNVAAKISLSADGNLSGHITSDTSEGNGLLMDVSEEIKTFLQGAGYNADGISAGTMANGIKTDTARGIRPSAEDIYGAAVSLVRAVGAVLK